MNRFHTAGHFRFTAIVLVAAASVLAAPRVATAQAGAEPDTDGWQFELTPYLFGASLSGALGVSTGIGDVTADVDMGFSDILENLDSGFMGLFEARRNRWGVAVEGVYFKLKNERASSWQGPLGGGGSGSLDATMTEEIYQLSIMYRALDERTKVDVLLAGRYTALDVDLNLAVTTGSPLLPDGSLSASGSESWWDPVVGVRVLQPLAEDWSFVGYADVGGTGSGSDGTYQLLLGVNWQFANHWAAKLGYRYLDQDFNESRFIWDMTSSGFYLGAGIRF